MKTRQQINIALGNRIKEVRNSKGMSQEDVALKADITPAYFGQVERGLKCPTIDTVYRISHAMKIPISGLLITKNQMCNERINYLISRIPKDKIESIVIMLESILDLIE